MSKTPGREGRAGQALRCQALAESLLEPAVETRLSLSQPQALAGFCPALAAEPRRLGAGKRGTEHVLAPPSDFPSALPRDGPALGIASSPSQQRAAGRD